MFNSYPTIWVYLNKSLNIAYLMSLHLFKNGSSLFSIKLMPVPGNPLVHTWLVGSQPDGPHQGLAYFLSGMGCGYIKEPAGQ